MATSQASGGDPRCNNGIVHAVSTLQSIPIHIFTLHKVSLWLKVRELSALAHTADVVEAALQSAVITLSKAASFILSKQQLLLQELALFTALAQCSGHLLLLHFNFILCSAVMAEAQ
jgi:hypothetical protein